TDFSVPPAPQPVCDKAQTCCLPSSARPTIPSWPRPARRAGPVSIPLLPGRSPRRNLSSDPQAAGVRRCGCIPPCSSKALTGSARVTFPLLAHTVESATLASTLVTIHRFLCQRPAITLRYSAKFRCDIGGNVLNALSSSTY